MKTSKQYKIYHSSVSQSTTDQQLEDWANDPDCENRDFVRGIIDARKSAREQADMERIESLKKKREAMLQNPFDPAEQISADARFISKRIILHMWVIFVLLPIVLGILFEALSK